MKGGHGAAGNDHSFHTSHIPESRAVPAVSSSPILSVVDDSGPLLGELAEVPAAPAGLLQTLAQVPDPRKPRGIRHGLPAVLAVALAAVVAGSRSFVAIAEWAADASPEVLSQLGMSPKVPSESTIRRCLQRLAPDQLDQLFVAWTWLHTSEISGRRVIAFDGKTLRGARDAAGNLVHLLAGLCQSTGTVLAQLAVGAKTNEIPMLPKLLDTLDITGVVITADALHCQRDTAAYIVGRGGHYILTVKDNQPTLRKRLKNLPWKQIPVLDTSTEHGPSPHWWSLAAVDVRNGLKACDPKRLAIYFTKHSSPNLNGDKEYQHIVPELWRQPGCGPGRFWGVYGLKKAVAVVEIARDAYLTARRIVRRWSRSQAVYDDSVSRFPTAVVPRTAVRLAPRVDTETGVVVHRRVRRRRMLCNQGGLAGGYALVNDGPTFGTQLAAALQADRALSDTSSFRNFRNPATLGRVLEGGMKGSETHEHRLRGDRQPGSSRCRWACRCPQLHGGARGPSRDLA